MQVQPVNSTNSKIKFTSSLSPEDRGMLTTFVNADDFDLATRAQLQASRDNYNKRHKQSMNSALYALPVVASLSSGIMAGGNLSNRAIAAGTTGAGWVGALLLLGVYDKVKNSVVSKSEKLQNFQQNHPMLSLALDFGLFTCAFFAGDKVVKKGLNKLENVSKYADLKASLSNKVKNALDNSVVNKRILPKITENVAKLYERAPRTYNVGYSVIKNSVWIVLLASIMRDSINIKKHNESVKKHFDELKVVQFNAAKALANDEMLEN